MAIYCVNFGVNFILKKFCLCKKNDKYEVCIVHVDDEVGVVGHLVVLIHEVVQQPPFVWSAVSSCHFCQFDFFYLQINFDLSRDG